MRLAPALAAVIVTLAPLTCLAAEKAAGLEDISPATPQVQSHSLDLHTATGPSPKPVQNEGMSALLGTGGIRGLDVRLRRFERSGTVEERYDGERLQHAGFGVELPMGSNAFLTSGYELSRREDGLGDQTRDPVDHEFRIGASLQF
jgi:hypothetical protein